MFSVVLLLSFLLSRRGLNGLDVLLASNGEMSNLLLLHQRAELWEGLNFAVSVNIVNQQ